LLSAAGIDGAYPVDYKAAAAELRSARKAGLLKPTGLTPAGMVNSIGEFGRFDNPSELAAGQWRASEAAAADLKAQGYSALAAVVGYCPGPGSLPLLGVAIRYFFRKAIEADGELAQALAFARLESLAETQKYQFESLNKAIEEQGERIEAALGEILSEVVEVKGVALDIRAEQDKLGDQNRKLMEAVLALQAKLDQVGRAAVRPQDSLSVRSDGERELVKRVIAQYRKLPSAERYARPALQNAVGLLEVAAGDFAAAQADFAAVAEHVADPAVKGAAYLNAYRAALEARDWDNALQELLAAVKSDSRRFAPFPMGKYKPERILGAGGFGVAFLCKHKYMDAQVVVKTLSGSEHDRDFEAVFAEARAAAAIQHLQIVRITDCGYADPNAKDRPFVVMDYFPGQSLDEYVRAKGPISVERMLPLARTLADALLAAHAKGILHRDVKPGNVLVKWQGNEFDSRLIDFGLAVQHKIAGSDASTSRSRKTLIGESIAGTVDYAAPEQMGRGASAIGPYSDVYGWAKTCCFSLFQTAQPTLRHWQGIPEGFADLLSRCLEENPKGRPQTFATVIEELDQLGPDGNAVVVGRLAPASSSRRAEPLELDDEDERSETRRERDEGSSRFRTKKKKKSSSFPSWILLILGLPIWVAILAAVGSVCLVVVMMIYVLAHRNSSDQQKIVQNALQNAQSSANAPAPTQSIFGMPAIPSAPPSAPNIPPGTFGVPGVGSGPSQGNFPPVRPGWEWPGGPPMARPDLPAGWKDTRPQGGAFARNEFRDVRQDGSYLIGFEIGLGKFSRPNDTIGYLRPIWQMPAGEQLGTAYGMRPAAGVWTMKAKEDYALAGAAIVGGGCLDGICFTFMKKKGNALDPTDYYVSEFFGDPLKKPHLNQTRVGDGSYLVGIHGTRYDDKGGNRFNDGGAIGMLGFVIAPTLPN
jgi:serine/threonine protein kinase